MIHHRDTENTEKDTESLAQVFVKK
jgi:hypothetical protein